MLLRPFGAMNGWEGTVGAETALGLAGTPMNDGTLPASGPSGIGWGATAARAGVESRTVTTAKAATHRATSRSGRRMSICTSPPQVWFGREIYSIGVIRPSRVTAAPPRGP